MDDEEVAVTLPLDLVEGLIAALRRRKVPRFTEAEKAYLLLAELEASDVRKKGNAHG